MSNPTGEGYVDFIHFASQNAPEHSLRLQNHTKSRVGNWNLMGIFLKVVGYGIINILGRIGKLAWLLRVQVVDIA